MEGAVAEAGQLSSKTRAPHPNILNIDRSAQRQKRRWERLLSSFRLLGVQLQKRWHKGTSLPSSLRWPLMAAPFDPRLSPQANGPNDINWVSLCSFMEETLSQLPWLNGQNLPFTFYQLPVLQNLPPRILRTTWTDSLATSYLDL